MLQLLAPCSQYSTDRCMRCGGSFRDHLLLRWSPHLYTPFDRMVDQFYAESVEEPASSSSKTKWAAGPNTKTNKPKMNFHRRYVLDLTHLRHQSRKDSPRAKAISIKRSIAKRYTGIPPDHLEQRVFPRWRQDSTTKSQNPTTPTIAYVIPRATSFKDFIVKSKPRTVFLWFFVREMCLLAVENLMELEAMD